MSSKSTVDLFNGLLAGLKENDKLKAQYNLQPPVMAQQQVPQVQIPMAPPVPQQPIPGIETAPPPIDVGQIAIPQPLVGSMVNRGSARAGDADRMQQAQQAQRIEDYGVPFDPASIPTGSFGRVYDSGLPPSSGFPTIPGGTGEKAPVYQDAGDYMQNWKKNNQAELDFIEANPEEVKKRETIVLKTPPPGFIEKALASAGLPNTAAIRNIAVEELKRTGNDFSSAENFGRVVRNFVDTPKNVVKSMLPGGSAAEYVGGMAYDVGEAAIPVVDAISTGVEYVADPLVRFGQGFVGTETTGVPTGSIPRLSDDSNQDIPKPEGSEIPKAEQELLDGEPAVDLTPTQPVVSTTQPAVTPTQTVEEEVEARAGGVGTINPEDLTVAGDALDPTLKEQVDTSIEKATGNKKLKEGAGEEEKEGFLKNLWGGVKGFFKEGFEDPMLRKTLLAYVLSKAVGADGVTAAGMVLEAEYKKDLAKTAREAASAEKQLDREYDLLQTMSKEQRAAYKKQQEDNKIDYTQSRTLYDKRTNKNYTGSVSPSGLIEIDDPSFYEGATMPDPNDPTKLIPIPAGTPLSMAALRQSGMYTLGEGKTSTEINKEMAAGMTTFFDTNVKRILSDARLAGADESAVEALEQSIRSRATSENLREAIVVYRSFYPAGTDFFSEEAQTILISGFNKWVTSITEGKEGNAKSLAAFLEREHIKYNDQNKLSESFFEANGEPIGAESWIKTSGKVKNLHGYLNRGRAGGNSEVTKPAVWNFLERAYLKQSDQMGDGFKDFWETESKKSAKNKAQAASPAMLWIQSIDRNKSTTGSKYFAGSMKDIIANMKN